MQIELILIAPEKRIIGMWHKSNSVANPTFQENGAGHQRRPGLSPHVSARSNDVAQHIGPRLVARQVGILFSPMVIETERPEIICVLDQ